MRRIAQRIDDPEIEAFEIVTTFGRDAVQIWRIGDIAEAEAERGDLAMIETEGHRLDRTTRPAHRAEFSRLQPPFCKQRRIIAAFRRLEDIAEMLAHDG